MVDYLRPGEPWGGQGLSELMVGQLFWEEILGPSLGIKTFAAWKRQILLYRLVVSKTFAAC
jgi:hypothetical protein